MRQPEVDAHQSFKYGAADTADMSWTDPALIAIPDSPLEKYAVRNLNCFFDSIKMEVSIVGEITLKRLDFFKKQS